MADAAVPKNLTDPVTRAKHLTTGMGKETLVCQPQWRELVEQLLAIIEGGDSRPAMAPRTTY